MKELSAPYSCLSGFNETFRQARQHYDNIQLEILIAVLTCCARVDGSS